MMDSYLEVRNLINLLCGADALGANTDQQLGKHDVDRMHRMLARVQSQLTDTLNLNGVQWVVVCMNHPRHLLIREDALHDLVRYGASLCSTLTDDAWAVYHATKYPADERLQTLHFQSVTDMANQLKNRAQSILRDQGKHGVRTNQHTYHLLPQHNRHAHGEMRMQEDNGVVTITLHTMGVLTLQNPAVSLDDAKSTDRPMTDRELSKWMLTNGVATPLMLSGVDEQTLMTHYDEGEHALYGTDIHGEDPLNQWLEMLGQHNWCKRSRRVKTGVGTWKYELLDERIFVLNGVLHTFHTDHATMNRLSLPLTPH